uniref:Uncharacterized protein n=1 Tax=Panagrolaimus sp. JU765 TaxID=591449 RepID=A0AC34R5Q1_9BILA
MAVSRMLAVLFLIFLAVEAHTYGPILWQAYRELSPFFLPSTKTMAQYCSIFDRNDSDSIITNTTRAVLIPSYFRRFLKEDF